MFTHKDIEHRTIFVVNTLQKRALRVSNGELLLEEICEDTGKKKTLTKFPFQKVLAIFVIGHMTLTTPLIEKCQKFGVALIVAKPNFRPVFYWANAAEANFLLHQRQYQYDKEDISIAKVLVANKIQNQIKTLQDTRRKDDLTQSAKAHCQACLAQIDNTMAYQQLMGLEGLASKHFFSAFFQDYDWHQRAPRAKCDAINATLDIGYSILFNYVECFLRMFGFDLYIGVYHRLWFKRKSLVCDLVEPYRCLIDKAVRTAYNRREFSENHFDLRKGEYILKPEYNQHYYQVFFEALVQHKATVFKYVQQYYRCFMQQKHTSLYPTFYI